MIREDEIYVRIKQFLTSKGWIVIGGEPPNGTNNIPRIELKDMETKEKGSKGSKKIDLVFFKDGYFLLNELKSIFNQKDVNKLNEITQNEKWRKSFINALYEKKIFKWNNIKINPEDYIKSNAYLIKSISYSIGSKIPNDFVVFVVDKEKITIKFGLNINNIIKSLFI